MVNVKGTVSRKKPLSVLSRHCACRNGVYVFGLVALLWLSWRVVGKSGDQQLASGAAYIHLLLSRMFEALPFPHSVAFCSLTKSAAGCWGYFDINATR